MLATLAFHARSCSRKQIVTIANRNFGGRSERVVFALAKLGKSLSTEGIDYCVLGGNALSSHGYDRATTDIDVLMTKEGLETFVRTHVGKGYVKRFEGATTKFRNMADDIPIDIFLTGSYPGDKQTEVAFPEPHKISYEESLASYGCDQTVRMVDLENLINLKLISFKDLPKHRIMDYVDILNLIEIHFLDESYTQHLHPSVHDIFLEAVAAVRDKREFEKGRY
jgi:hypothetical protein